jgi:hypothetical protein
MKIELKSSYIVIDWIIFNYIKHVPFTCFEENLNRSFYTLQLPRQKQTPFKDVWVAETQSKKV